VLTQQAVASHFHTNNLIQHGLVHGESDSDGSFFARTYGYHVGALNDCVVGQLGDGRVRYSLRLIMQRRRGAVFRLVV